MFFFCIRKHHWPSGCLCHDGGQHRRNHIAHKKLGTKASPHAGSHDANPLIGNVQGRSHISLAVGRCRDGAVDGQHVIIPLRNTHRGFRRHGVLAAFNLPVHFHNDIRPGKSCFRITHLKIQVIQSRKDRGRYIARKHVIELGCVRSQRFVNGEYRRQFLILHFNQFHGIQCNVLCVRHHQGHRVPHKPDCFIQRPVVGRRSHLVCNIDVVRYVLVCNHSMDPVTGLCPVHINPGNTRMGVRASEHLAVNHSCHPQVIRKHSLPGDNVICYDTLDFPANYLVILVHSSLLLFST